MKLTITVMLVAKALERLLKDSPDDVYGLRIVEASGLLSGTVYPILCRMEDNGMLEATLREVKYPHCGWRVQRHLTLTDAGRAFLVKVHQRLGQMNL